MIPPSGRKRKPRNRKQAKGRVKREWNTLACKAAQQVVCFAYTFTPKTEVVYLSETSLNVYRITQRYINVIKSTKYVVFIT